MLRIGQRVLTGNVEFVKFDVVQEHIDAAQVVRCDVDFLPKEAVAHGTRPSTFSAFSSSEPEPQAGS